MNEAEINRMIAKQAARGIYLYAHQQQGTSDLRARLLAEAKATDRFYCSDDEMVVMAEAEYRKLRGNALGGHVAAAKKQGEKNGGLCVFDERTERCLMNNQMATRTASARQRFAG